MGWGHMRQLGTMHGHHALLRVAACPVLHSRRPVPALRCMPPVQGNRQQILDCGDDGLLVAWCPSDRMFASMWCLLVPRLVYFAMLVS